MAMRIMMIVICLLWSGSVFADETISKEPLTKLFQEGKLSEGVEIVMANLKQCAVVHTARTKK